jgi:hypothetical protein
MRSFKTRLTLLAVLASLLVISCSKSSTGNSSSMTLSYGDSILYLKNQSSDFIVYPTENGQGIYTAFPDGIELNPTTGAINISKSETGLRYRITFTSTSGETASTTVVLSGITYYDKFYHLSLGDSIAMPVYNANMNRALPLNGSTFDEGNNANSGGCSVKTVNGQINLAQTVRNGVFGTVPQNDAKQEFDIFYRLNDQSGNAKNKIRVKVYYYATMNDVAADLLQTLNDRESQGVFLGNSYSNLLSSSSTLRTTSNLAVAKPRPPCVIIIGQ